MTKYYAFVVKEKKIDEFEESINQVLTEFTKKGWKLHSQASPVKYLGDVMDPYYYCTLIFEKEGK